MDRRKKRTSTNQYMMYIDLMEKDQIFATGRVPRDVDANYLQKKWKELAEKLNTCSSGPTLSAEEWRKRLNDWKNTTRCKYRRSLSGEKDISLTALEIKALELFGKTPNVSSSEQISVTLKSEKEDGDEEMEQQHTSEEFQKELQAAVEEAIGGDEDDMDENQEEHEEIITGHPNTETTIVTSGGGGNTGGGPTYRTIVVENAHYSEDDNDQVEYIPTRRHTLNSAASSATTGTTMQTMVSTTPTGTVTKLINGDIPLKRLRSQAPEQVIYEVKKASMQHQPVPRTITIHNTTPHLHNQHQYQTHYQTDPLATAPMLNGITTQDAREIARQLKRLADAKSEKLKFEIAKFKFNNPGFHYPSL